jgi:alkylation response protein AidB-like acyl-CoA dehydrogenase
MDFVVSDDQRALAAGIRQVLDGRFAPAAVRAREGAPDVVDPAGWAALADAGVFALVVPESDGGVGLGLVDAAVVFEELGRALVPGPLVGTTLAAGHVEGAATGAARYGLLEHRAGGVVPRLVEHPHSVDGFVVLPPAGATGGASLVDVDALELVDLDAPVDPLTPVARLDGAVPAGRPLGDDGRAASLRLTATVLTAALGVGSAAACVDLAVAYATERRQFGRPIGGFQAVKHLCADMLVRAELARAALHAAAVLADEPDVAAAEAAAGPLDAAAVVRRAAAGAKALADEAAWRNARAGIQVHGGMGFTWEVPVHLHLKRALVRQNALGTPDEQCAAIAATI